MKGRMAGQEQSGRGNKRNLGRRGYKNSRQIVVNNWKGCSGDSAEKQRQNWFIIITPLHLIPREEVCFSTSFLWQSWQSCCVSWAG